MLLLLVCIVFSLANARKVRINMTETSFYRISMIIFNHRYAILEAFFPIATLYVYSVTLAWARPMDNCKNRPQKDIRGKKVEADQKIFVKRWVCIILPNYNHLKLLHQPWIFHFCDAFSCHLTCGEISQSIRLIKPFICSPLYWMLFMEIYYNGRDFLYCLNLHLPWYHEIATTRRYYTIRCNCGHRYSRQHCLHTKKALRTK